MTTAVAGDEHRSREMRKESAIPARQLELHNVRVKFPVAKLRLNAMVSDGFACWPFFLTGGVFGLDESAPTMAPSS